ncbi:MAG: 50S ribosomal protein L15 [Treponema sp.]|nr:MAG: 50S ribosomal protein L15 [Treponema sp.]
MSDFNLIAPKGANRKKRIVGRGSSSGHGTTSGRGNKGQKSRSGGKSYVGFEGGQMPLYRRVPKRGFSNYPFKKEYVVFNLSQIENRYESGEVVSIDTLLAKGLLKKKNANVKILGNGDITKSIDIDIRNISASAKAKIEKAGGKILSSKD